MILSLRAGRRDALPPLTRMILLFGLPRSGTSWLGKIFDSHPETLYRHEPDSWFKSHSIPMTPAPESLEDLQVASQEYLRAIFALRPPSVSAKLPIFAKSYYPFPVFLIRKWSAIGAQIWARYIGTPSVPEFVSRRRRDQVRTVWKSIESVGRLGLFVRLLSNCHAILIIRHPCGQIASVLRGESGGRFRDSAPSSEDYGILEALLNTGEARRHGLTMSALIAMQPLERLAWRWVLFNDKALAEIEGLDNCMTIRYEDLCVDPAGMTQRMFTFTGLTWCDETRRFLDQSIGKEKSGYYSLAKKPLRSAYKWRNELSAGDIDSIVAIARRSRAGRLFFEDRDGD